MPYTTEDAILTSDGRRRVEQRLTGLTTELEHVDARIKAGDATADDLSARHAISQQLEELRRLLARAADVATVEEDPAVVEVGDEVDVEHLDGDLETYAVVHPAEADAASNRVSVQAPIGSALLGAMPGDVVTVQAPGDPYTFRVRARRRLA